MIPVGIFVSQRARQRSVREGIRHTFFAHTYPLAGEYIKEFDSFQLFWRNIFNNFQNILVLDTLLDDEGCIAVSYPGFLRDLEMLETR